MQFPPSLVQAWVKTGSRILDLGCGDGSLLRQLIQERQVSGYGLEIDPANIQACVEAGINILEQDLDLGLANFAAGSFDTVVMTQTLQAVHYPDRVLLDMLRVGKEGIVSFPNFAHWYCRFHLAVKGRMPVSKFMPYHWYDTPNIHFCTVSDFERLCEQNGIQILSRAIVNRHNRSQWFARLWPNLFAATAIYRITRKQP